MAINRPGRPYSRELADNAKRIDINWLLRQRLLKQAYTGRFDLHWTRGDRPAGTIDVTFDMTDIDAAHMTLVFAVTVLATGERHDYRQHVRLSYTRQRLGGLRWWMHCPLTGRRVAKLYCPNGAHVFASRQYHGLAYASQREAGRDKPFERLHRLQRRLGCRRDFELPHAAPRAFGDARSPRWRSAMINCRMPAIANWMPPQQSSGGNRFPSPATLF